MTGKARATRTFRALQSSQVDVYLPPDRIDYFRPFLLRTPDGRVAELCSHYSLHVEKSKGMAFNPKEFHVQSIGTGMVSSGATAVPVTVLKLERPWVTKTRSRFR